MRVALCSYEIAGVRGGGIGTYVAEAGRALTAAGHEVWLITSKPSQRGGVLDEAFAEVRYIDDAATPESDLKFGLARHSMRAAQLAFDVLRESGVDFDYVEFADFEGWGAVAVQEQRLFGSLGDAAVAVVLHSPSYECARYNEVLHLVPPSDRELMVLEDATIRGAPGVWSPSTRLREMTAARLGLSDDFAEVIHYPMRFSSAPAPSAPKRRLEDLDILFFGRIEPRKGVRQLVDAFNQLPELRIECIGRDGHTSPQQTSEVEYLRRRSCGNVSFAPPMARDAMLARLRRADLVILPSPWENWPNACIEAMAENRVVIGGRNGGMGEMIEHGVSGFLVDGDDPDDIARVIREDVAAALPHFGEIGERAGARIRELSDPFVYVAAIERFVEARRGRGQLPVAPTAPASPKVSIIVPFYNESLDLVGAAVDSAIAQSYGNLEIIVVEDGSPRRDASEILASLGARDPRLKILRKANGGLATARNYAIERAEGEYFLFCDADNILLPDYAAVVVDVFSRSTEAAAVVPRFQIFDDSSGEDQTIVQGLPFDRALNVFRNSVGDAGAAFRREVFCEHGLRYDVDVDTYSDWALWMDIASLGLPIETVPRVLYRYRQRKGSMMSEYAWDRHLPMVGMLIKKHLPDTTEREREVLITLLQGWGVGAILSALSGRADTWEEPVKVARRLRPGQTRYDLAEAIGRVADKFPRLGALGRRLFKRALAAHGRWKDRRR